MNLLQTNPLTRINDCFIEEGNCHNIDMTPVRNNIKNSIVLGNPNVDHRFKSEFYQSIGIDIVAETAFNYPYQFVTEKTFRSFYNLRPFIILGPYHTLDFIKQQGFKTFSAIIDESYDNIQNSELRFIAVCNSIEKFVCRPISQIQKDLEQVSDVLRYNQSHILNLVDIELEKLESKLNV